MMVHHCMLLRNPIWFQFPTTDHLSLREYHMKKQSENLEGGSVYRLTSNGGNDDGERN
jgi:hypothetical protein